MGASPTDHLAEWLHLALEYEDGIDHWRDYFDQARTTWQLDQAQKLLRTAKQTSFSNRELALVRYSEGVLYAQLGEWDRAVKCFMHGVDLG